MAGRQKLILTLDDVKQLIKHIQQLPFKRKIEQRFLDILPGKKSMADFSESDLLLVKKCRYEKNAYLKQMAALAKIQSQSTPTKFEREILDLAKRSDIDAHFLKLDALKNYLQQQDQKKAENKLRNQKKRIDSKVNKTDPSLKKQRDRENYYLGAMCKKLFELTGFHANQPNDLKRLQHIFIDAAATAVWIEKNQITEDQKIRTAERHVHNGIVKTAVDGFEQDSRNPFKATERSFQPSLT
ncbi:hypothetical protein [Acinetobacter sp. ANC 3832]|uniref:hypothetical protein n=1 Tax=Acinetobacter sp. ANC 3832 TaxID=1977874 RepID=UPI000A333FFB|nr:hypothetical protein [Acinetobacter sp. ANC 3832]OTG86893.1 hypothetical protein B9T35_17925 [Acinetobacter sp. ANC 3832]